VLVDEFDGPVPAISQKIGPHRTRGSAGRRTRGASCTGRTIGLHLGGSAAHRPDGVGGPRSGWWNRILRRSGLRTMRILVRGRRSDGGTSRGRQIILVGFASLGPGGEMMDLEATVRGASVGGAGESGFGQ
jgi:hypothetical protein